ARGVGELEAEQKFEVGKAIVPAHEHIIAEEHQCRSVGDGLRKDGKVDAFNARPERKEAEDERKNARRKEHHDHRERKAREGLPKVRQFSPTEKDEKVGDRLMML